MSTKQWEATTTIFYSNDGSPTVTLKSKNGQTLNLIGTASGNVTGAAEPNTSVQFNNSGNFDGDSSFVYANSTLSVPNVNTDLVEKIVSSDSLGYNQIYDGPGLPFPATVGSTHTATNFNFAYDLEVSELNDTIVFAAPHYVLGGSTGGVDVFSRSGTVFNEYSSALTYSNFTLEATTSSVSISDDGLYISMPDNSQDCWVYLFKKTAGTWALLTDNMDIIRHQAKISMTLPALITMLSVDRSSIFSITEIDLAGVFGTPTEIFNAGVVPNEGYLPMAIHQYFCMINVGGNSKYYQRIAGVWTLIDTISGAVNECDICSVSQTNYISVYSRTSGGLVIKTSYGTQTFTGNYGAVTCNDSRVFAYNTDNSEIEIYNIQNDQSFVKSVNNTAITSVNKMSASYSYLACSQTADNQATIFKIQEYTNHDVELIKISLDSTTQKVEITSPSGVDISSDLTVSGVLSTTASAFSEPELKMSSGGSGLHYNSNTVSTLINYSSVLDTNENYIQGNKQYRAVSGSLSSPGYSFIGDTDSGMYRIGANNLGLALNGIKQIDYGTVRTTFTNPILAPAGTAALPAIATGFNNCGLYQFGSAIGLSVSGVSQLTTDATHTVTTNPFKHLTNGSASAPSFSWVNSGNTGMYYNTNEVNFTVNGTRKLKISNTGATHTDSLKGLTSPTTTFDLGASGIDLGLGGSYRQRIGPSGNSLADISIGNGCNLASNNPTLGSVLRINADGAGRWGTENIVTGGATQFHLFLATSTGVGSISTNSVTTSYNTTSSRLLKKDINLMDTAVELDRINLLRPSKYKWRSNDAPGESFIADELEELFPDCVVGTDTEINGRMDYKQVDTTHLIASLVSAVQELSKQNDLLRSDIEAMKIEMATFV